MRWHNIRNASMLLLLIIALFVQFHALSAETYHGVLNCKPGEGEGEGEGCENISEPMSFEKWTQLRNSGKYESGTLRCHNTSGEIVESFSRINVIAAELEQFIAVYRPRVRGRELLLSPGIVYWSGRQMPEPIRYLGSYWRPGICEFLYDEGREGELTFIPSEGAWITLIATDASNTVFQSKEGALTVSRQADGTFSAVDTEGLSRRFSAIDGGTKIAGLTAISGKNDPGMELTINYDASGKLETLTFQNRTVAKLIYDNAGHITEVRNGRNRALVKMSYDASGELASITRVFGERNGGGSRPGRMRDGRNREGWQYTFTYDNNGRMISKQRPNEATVRYSYDQDGRVATAVDGNGKSVSIRHLSETEAEYTDRMGRVTRWEYVKGRPHDWTKKTDALGRVIVRNLDAKGRVIWQSDPCGCGNGIQYTYDDHDNVVVKSDNLGNIETFVYDERNNKTVYCDKRGNITKYEYDASGNLLRKEEPLGAVVTYAYDADSNLVSRANAQGQTEQKFYDEAGNLIREIDPVGGVTEYTYDEFGHIATKRDADGYLTGYTNDKDGNILKEIGPVGDLNGDSSINAADLAVAEAAGNYLAYEYDSAGNVLSSRDRNGNVTENEYDAQANLVRTTYPDSSYEQFWHDAEGNVIKSRSRGGHFTFYEYDAAGQMTREIYDNGDTVGQVDPADAYIQYVYNERGQIIFQRDRNGNMTERIYDEGGRLIKEVDAAGGFTTTEYDANDNVIKRVDKEGGQTLYEYDANNKLVRTTDHYGNETLYVYDDAGRMTSITDPRGTIIAFEYDGADRMLRRIDDYGTGRLNIVTEYAYDGRGNRVQEIRDAGSLSQLLRYFYDSYGRMFRVIDPTGALVEYAYDNNGNRIGQTYRDASSSFVLSTSMAYNVNNQMTSQTSPQGIVTAFEYDANGNMLSEILDFGSGRMNIVNRYEYDGLDRLVQEIRDSGQGAGHANAAAHFSYDANGNLIAVVDPSGRSITAEYDALNRLTRIIDPLGNTVIATYNKNGNLIEVCDENGRSTFAVYDALGRIIREINQMNQPVEYTYDAAGNRLTLKDANGNVSAWAYDALGRPLTLSYPNGNVEAYAYDRLGRLTAKTKPDSTVIGYTYNSAGKLQQITTPEGNVTYTYSPAGLLLSESSPGGSISYTYDAFGRQVAVTDHNLNRTVNYEYNALGARTRMVLDGVEVVYSYDRMLNLSSVQKTGEAVPAIFSYDATGRRLGLQLPNGVNTTYAYDAAGRLTGVESKNTAQQVISAFAYTLDPTGNRTGMSLNLGGTINHIQYEFDNAYRLTRETRKDASNQTIFDEQFTYDAVGNRLGKVTWHAGGGNVSTANTYNNANQLVSSVTDGVTTNYAYDLNGNTISIVEPGKTVTMTHDWLNRQTSWGDGTNTEIQTYLGGSWKRASTTVNGASVKYLYDGDNVIGDFDASNNLTAFYVTPFLDQNISLTNTQGQAYYYTQDGLGSVRSLTDASGAVANKYDYTAFGQIASAGTVEGIANRYQYTGREASSLASAGAPMYYRWRNYSPSIGRFLWRDPIGYEDGVNIYVYVANMPLVVTDMYGLNGVCPYGGNFSDGSIYQLDRDLAQQGRDYYDKHGWPKPPFKEENTWTLLARYATYSGTPVDINSSSELGIRLINSSEIQTQIKIAINRSKAKLAEKCRERETRVFATSYSHKESVKIAFAPSIIASMTGVFGAYPGGPTEGLFVLGRASMSVDINARGDCECGILKPGGTYVGNFSIKDKYNCNLIDNDYATPGSPGVRGFWVTLNWIREGKF